MVAVWWQCGTEHRPHRSEYMGVSIRIRNGIIHLMYRAGNRRCEETTGLRVSSVPEQNREVMRLAEILRSKREIELVRGFNGMEPAESRMTLYDYVKKCAASSGSGMEKVLPYLEMFGGRLVKISAVTPRWFEDFQNRMIFDSGLKSPHSQEKYCCNVRQCLKRAVRDGILLRDPSSGIKHIRVPDSTKEFLTAQEVRKMAVTEFWKPKMDRGLQEEVRRAFLFGCCTGFRISDLMLLDWSDISLERMEIVKRQKKTRKIVAVPIRTDTLDLIDTGNHEGPVFPKLASSRSSTNRYIHGWAEKAGIKKNVTWHTARHTDATLLIECGTDLYTVMRLLGHTKIQTTMQYAVVSDTKKRNAVESLPQLLPERQI